MPRFSSRLFLSIFTIAAGSGALAAEAAARTGVEGTVSVSPTRPGPERLEGPGRAPLRGEEIRLLTKSGAIAGRAATSSDGHFVIEASPGEYELRVVVRRPYPRCGSASVTIRDGRISTVDLACDSGMR